MTILLEANRTERIVVLTKMLVLGQSISTQEAAAACGVTQRTIQRDLAEMSRVIPIYPDGGRWIYAPDSTAVSISPY